MERLIEFIVGSAFMSGVLIFLGKLIINKGFDAALKTFETKLDLMKIEHQIRFSELHQQRALIMKSLYKELFLLEKKLDHMTTSFQGPEWSTDDSRKKQAMERLSICQDMVEENRILFPEQFWSKIERSLSACEDVIKRMEKAKSLERNKGYDRSSTGRKETPLQVWLNEEERVKTEIRNNRIELANDFRALLGANDKIEK